MQTSLLRVLSLPLISGLTLGNVLNVMNSFSHLCNSSHLIGLLKGLSQHTPAIMTNSNQGLIFTGLICAFGMTVLFSSPNRVPYWHPHFAEKKTSPEKSSKVAKDTKPLNK